ncbi:MAG: S1 RNA-binding domain-containing protein [Chloroflexi bacterium]|nr:S1 RNA-binding domain-containing protein [Chloroflexota bacterium]
MESSAVTVEDRLKEIKPKMHLTGTVTKMTIAGAIVDIGLHLPGVLHISQIQPASPDQPVKRVEDVLQVGQSVELWVKKVKEDRIELTMIKPLDLEWRDLKKGMVVKGKVTRLEKFGAFVEIGAERPGLIHISEMAHGYVRTPSDVVKEGDEVEAQVLDVNRRKKQIKLSLKALQEEPVKETEPAKLIETAQRTKPTRRRKSSRGEGAAGEENKNGAAQGGEGSQPVESEPTAMEIALREAMERAKEKKKEQAEKGKRGKSVSKEQEDLLSRTLEHKVRTS